MRTRTSMWFECKIRYDKLTDEGLSKNVTEQYVVDALSYTEAEKNIIRFAAEIIPEVIEIRAIKEAAYNEIFFSENDAADKWYKTKINFISIDERTGKERRTNVLYLVQANDISNAISNVKEIMSKSMSDYTIQSMALTQILDVFEYKEKE